MSKICCYNTVNDLVNFVIGLTNDHPLAVNPQLGSYTMTCDQYWGTASAGATVSVQCNSAASSRYVTVQNTLSDQIGLCEVEVYAHEGKCARFRVQENKINAAIK